MYFTNQAIELVPTTDKLIAAVLVTLMQLGFSCLEAGLVDARNTLSILYKNLLDFTFGVLGFILVWTLFVDSSMDTPDKLANLLYSATFAATAATICSGALAGRIRLTAYVTLSIFITSIIYPIVSWFLFIDQAAKITPEPSGISNGVFYDLAGSVAVHSVGGAAALAAALYVGPRTVITQTYRLSRASSNSDIQALRQDSENETEPSEKRMLIRSHNLPLANIGMFLLVVGWYGFNVGSARIEADMSIIALNTLIAGAAGGSGVFLFGKLTHSPSFSFNINGVLGGLVIITSCANLVEPWQAALLGGVAGVSVALWLNFLNRQPGFLRRFEDPVGAFPVHGICGFLGGIAVVVFGSSRRVQELSVEGESIKLTLFETSWQIGFTILIPILTFIAILIFLRFYDWIAQTNNLMSGVIASADEQGVGLDVADYVDRAYDFGEHSDKPEDLYEQLQIVMKRFPIEEISFDKCALDKSNKVQRSNQPFMTSFSFWSNEITYIAERYSDSFGEYAAGKDDSARDISERLSTAIRRLSQYVYEPSLDLKKQLFENRAKELKSAVRTLENILWIHVEQRIKGHHYIESTARELEELRRDLDLLKDQISSSTN